MEGFVTICKQPLCQSTADDCLENRRPYQSLAVFLFLVIPILLLKLTISQTRIMLARYAGGFFAAWMY